MKTKIVQLSNLDGITCYAIIKMYNKYNSNEVNHYAGGFSDDENVVIPDRFRNPCVDKIEIIKAKYSKKSTVFSYYDWQKINDAIQEGFKELSEDVLTLREYYS